MKSSREEFCVLPKRVSAFFSHFICRLPLISRLDQVIESWQLNSIEIHWFQYFSVPCQFIDFIAFGSFNLPKPFRYFSIRNFLIFYFYTAALNGQWVWLNCILLIGFHKFPCSGWLFFLLQLALTHKVCTKVSLKTVLRLFDIVCTTFCARSGTAFLLH